MGWVQDPETHLQLPSRLSRLLADRIGHRCSPLGQDEAYFFFKTYDAGRKEKERVWSLLTSLLAFLADLSTSASASLPGGNGMAVAFDFVI